MAQTSETSVFSNLLKRNSSGTALPIRMREAREWVQKHATSAMRDARTVISKAPTNATKTTMSNSIVGSMVLFQYEATTAKNLPYWDRYPLVFPFDITGDGMYGINMHYLPLPYRAKLMDALYNIADAPTITDKTKLQLSYQALQSVARNRLFQPCVKRYLNTGLASKLVVIPATEWNVALFLPLERFQKASTSRVHRDSQRIIRG